MQNSAYSMSYGCNKIKNLILIQIPWNRSCSLVVWRVKFLDFIKPLLLRVSWDKLTQFLPWATIHKTHNNNTKSNVIIRSLKSSGFCFKEARLRKKKNLYSTSTEKGVHPINVNFWCNDNKISHWFLVIWNKIYLGIIDFNPISRRYWMYGIDYWSTKSLSKKWNILHLKIYFLRISWRGERIHSWPISLQIQMLSPSSVETLNCIDVI